MLLYEDWDIQVWRITTTEQRRATFLPPPPADQIPPFSPEPPASSQRAGASRGGARPHLGKQLHAGSQSTTCWMKVQENEKYTIGRQKIMVSKRKSGKRSLAQAQSNLKLLNTRLEELVPISSR